MPAGQFENIIWDAAIEHFTLAEIKNILEDIKNRLTGNGILSVHTIVERTEGKSLSQHEYEFKSKEDLYEVVNPFFRNVTVFETIYPSRHNLYLWASDSVLPFSDNCKFVVSNNQFEQESITLDSDIKTFVEKIAEHKNTDKNKIVNMLIRNNKTLLEQLSQIHA